MTTSSIRLPWYLNALAFLQLREVPLYIPLLALYVVAIAYQPVKLLRVYRNKRGNFGRPETIYKIFCL